MPIPEENIICINGDYIKAVKHNGKQNIFQLFYKRELIFESPSCFSMIDYYFQHNKQMKGETNG